MKQAIIFDKDGVLTDTLPFMYQITTSILKEYNQKLSYDEFLDYAIKQMKPLYEKYFSPFLTREKYDEKKRRYYHELFDSEFRLMPGVKEKIFELSTDFKFAVATGNYSWALNKELEFSDLKKYFSAFVSCDDVSKNKPDPEIYNKAVNLLGVNKYECIVIEDSYAGLCAAKAAGLKCIAIPNEYTKDNDFSKADLILNSFSKLNKEIIQKV